MAYVVVDKEQLDAGLTVVADAIREKGGTAEPLAFPNGMAEAVRGIQSGGGVNYIDYLKYFESAFSSTTFPENTEITIDSKRETMSYNMGYMFDRTKNVRKIKISGNIDDDKTLTLSQFANYSQNLEEVDFSGINRLVLGAINLAFNSCEKIKRIIGELDFSQVTAMSSTFSACNALETITIKKGTISANISFSKSAKLSSESIQSIIDGLSIVENRHTLTLHTDVVAKLTQEQLDTISAKNWNVG